MASRIISNRCAVCGGSSRRQSLFTFVLLQESCRKFDVPLRVPTSTHFHEKCSRRAYKALSKKPCVAFLAGGIK